MFDEPSDQPAALRGIRADARRAGFSMSCDERTGSLLSSLAAGAAHPGGRVLELGTGVGEGAAWLLSGMPRGAALVTVELDRVSQDIAREHLGGDPRAEFVTGDGGQWLEDYSGPGFDLVFADTWPGKFTHLDRALALVNTGGMYVIDDLRGLPDWPAEHTAAVHRLLHLLDQRPDFRTTRLDWSTGLLLAVRTG